MACHCMPLHTIGMAWHGVPFFLALSNRIILLSSFFFFHFLTTSQLGLNDNRAGVMFAPCHANQIMSCDCCRTRILLRRLFFRYRASWHGHFFFDSLALRNYIKLRTYHTNRIMLYDCRHSGISSPLRRLSFPLLRVMHGVAWRGMFFLFVFRACPVLRSWKRPTGPRSGKRMLRTATPGCWPNRPPGTRRSSGSGRRRFAETFRVPGMYVCVSSHVYSIEVYPLSSNPPFFYASPRLFFKQVSGEVYAFSAYHIPLFFSNRFTY